MLDAKLNTMCSLCGLKPMAGTLTLVEKTTGEPLNLKICADCYGGIDGWDWVDNEISKGSQ